ncbi:MAG: virulence factor MviN [Gammaproteobacteria bacterium]|nr:virulence factor MviN [Gammaproteobacteria bacterium]
MINSQFSVVCYWQRLAVWSQASNNRKIFAALITTGGFSLIVSLAAMLKDLQIAHQFGRGDALDVFLIAFLLPSFGVNVIASSFNAALIPVYIQVREQQGSDPAQRLFSSVMVWSGLLLIAASIIFATLIHFIMPYLASNFSAEKRILTEKLFFILLPVLAISGVTTIWTAILHAGERFALAAFTPIMLPVTVMVFLVVFGDSYGVFSLAVGTVVGFIFQCCLLGIALKRLKIKLCPRWYGMTSEFRKVISQYLPMVGGAILMSSTTLVDQTMAAMLDSGSVSALNYGNKLVVMILGIGTMALGSAVLPYFSKMLAVKDWEGLIHTIKTYSKLILLVSIPLTIFIYFFSEALIRFIFERGSFTEKDTLIVAKIQKMYALQIPFYLLGSLLVRLIFAMGINQRLLLIFLIDLTVKIGLNFIFIRWINITGIALSTSIIYLINLIVYIFVIRLYYAREIY